MAYTSTVVSPPPSPPAVDRVLYANNLAALFGALFLPTAQQCDVALRLLIALPRESLVRLLASCRAEARRDIVARLSLLARTTKDVSLAQSTARAVRNISLPVADDARATAFATGPILFESWISAD
jgi:hypothetical protein